MNLSNILEYQNLDRELFKIEKQLRDNENKKKANLMHNNMLSAQSKSFKLEEKAGVLVNEINKVKKQFQIQEDKMNEFMNKDLTKLSENEIEKLNVLKNKLGQNLSILEKNLTQLAESVNAVLSEFNKEVKLLKSSKEEYLKAKSAYDVAVSSVEEDKKKIESKLSAVAKTVSADILEAYQKRRKENIFPVVVKLDGNSCGGCHIEQPYANISKLENDGVLICEHCHRIIYKG